MSRPFACVIRVFKQYYIAVLLTLCTLALLLLLSQAAGVSLAAWLFGVDRLC